MKITIEVDAYTLILLVLYILALSAIRQRLARRNPMAAANWSIEAAVAGSRASVTAGALPHC